MHLNHDKKYQFVLNVRVSVTVLLVFIFGHLKRLLEQV